MDCKHVEQCIDDYLDGALPAGELRLVEGHLTGCLHCRSELKQIQQLRHSLRSLPVPPPSPEFSRRVLVHAQQHNPHRRRQHLLGGLATAIAASLVLWFGIALFQTSPNPTGIDTIVMRISDTREVKLVFNSPVKFDQVTLQLNLSDNLELAGYAGRTTISWKTALKQGPNILALPITALSTGQGEVIARLIHEGKIRVLRVPMEVQGASSRRGPANTTFST